MSKCALLLEENAEFDFMDINMGCPIDFIYKQVLILLIICFIFSSKLYILISLFTNFAATPQSHILHTSLVGSSGWGQCLDAAAGVSRADGAGHDTSAESAANPQDAHRCVP